MAVAESVCSHLQRANAYQLMIPQPLRKTEEEVSSIAKLVIDNYEDEEIRNQFLTLAVQLFVLGEIQYVFLC